MHNRCLPPGANVGTPLRALRAKKAREQRQSAMTDTPSSLADPHQHRTQLSLPSADGWFAAHGWQPFEFQREVWRHVAEGRSGLLHATTGSGKTYAVWFSL